MFKIWRKYIFTQILSYFPEWPILSFINFCFLNYRNFVINCWEWINEFTLPVWLPNITFQKPGFEIYQAQFFFRLPEEGFFNCFSYTYMPTYRGIPFPGLNVFAQCPLLQESSPLLLKRCRWTTGWSSLLTPLWHKLRVAFPIIVPSGLTIGNHSSFFNFRIRILFFIHKKPKYAAKRI